MEEISALLCSVQHYSQQSRYRKKPKCQQQNKGIVQYLQYSVIIKMEILPFTTIWMDLEGIVLSERCQRQILHGIIFM